MTNTSADNGTSLTRVTVNLTTKSVASMDALTKLTGENKTEVINKSLQFYDDVQTFISTGGTVYMRDPGSKELERIRIF